MRFWRRGVPEDAAADADLAPPVAEPAPEAAPPRGWLGQLRGGLARSSARLTEGINAFLNDSK